MARRRIALLLLVAGLGGCGAEREPAPRPAPAPEPRIAENHGELKAATWRAAAAAEAARLARLRAAIRRAKESRTVRGALRYALLTGRMRVRGFGKLGTFGKLFPPPQPGTIFATPPTDLPRTLPRPLH